MPFKKNALKKKCIEFIILNKKEPGKISNITASYENIIMFQLK